MNSAAGSFPRSETAGINRCDLVSFKGSAAMTLTRPFMIAILLCAVPASGLAAPRPTQASIAARIKGDVAEIIAGINAKDIDKATKFDAPDLVSMESGREPSAGAQADHDGLSMTFKYAPDWHLTLIDETVDVARAGDMAVYRGTYAEDSLHDGVPFTHKGNYIAGFRRDADGQWRVHWSVIAWQSPSKKKG
jgi:ketosteroid isomerase-like protein